MNTERLVLGPLGTNCYIVYDTESGDAAIFDPADNCNIILAKIKDLRINPKYIIVTHAHCDHIAALDELKNTCDAKVCIGSDESKALNDAYLSLCSHFGTSAPVSKADIELKDGDSLYLGDKKLTFIHTPGHTKGGICAYYDSSLISGDTLFSESVGRSDFPGGSMSELTASIKNKLFVLPDDTLVYPGHGESTTIGHEKNNNPYVW